MLKELIKYTGSRPLICLEVNPPRGTELKVVLHRLLDQLAGIDFINITDSALAKMRMASLPFAARLKQELKIEPLVNLSCRDRNILALQADLLAAWTQDVRSIVALTGDAMTVGDSPERKGVFEINSVGLLGLVSRLNSGTDMEGHTLDGATDYTCGCVSNPNARNHQAEIKRLIRKKGAGAKYALSQPVFDLTQTEEFLKTAQAVQLPIMLGLMPWKSPKHALALANVPGIKIPDLLLQEWKTCNDVDCSERSIEFCVSMARSLKHLVRGFHVVSGPTPKLALKLAQALVKEFAP